MTDRELLEFAAKAVGYTTIYMQCLTDSYMIVKELDSARWNPIADDGDALRLAVALQLGISIPPVSDGRVEVVTFYGSIISVVEYPENDDRYAATRRAIVRCAAEIGKGMK